MDTQSVMELDGLTLQRLIHVTDSAVGEFTVAVVVGDDSNAAAQPPHVHVSFKSKGPHRVMLSDEEGNRRRVTLGSSE